MQEKIEVDIKVPNQTRYLSLIGRIGEDIARTLKRYRGDREELAYQVNLVLTEATTNAILHAASGVELQQIHINIAIVNQQLQIKVYDQGQGFDPETLPKPNARELKESGRGVYIIQSLMDEVTCSKVSGGHVLKMVKFLH